MGAENGVNYGHCSAELSLTATQGAYYDQPDIPTATTETGSETGDGDPAQGEDGDSDLDPELVVGSAERTDSVVIRCAANSCLDTRVLALNSKRASDR